MRIAIISGSPRGNSVTYRMAIHLEDVIKQKAECETDIIDLRIIEMPQLQSIFTSVEAAPEEYKSLAQRMFSADAFILITPEYNGSYSAALKNLLDHFPKQHHKVFGIVTASPGGLGGLRAAQQLLLLVPALFGVASPYLLIVPNVDKKFNSQGELIDEKFQNNVHNFTAEYLWLAENVVTEKLKQKAVA